MARVYRFYCKLEEIFVGTLFASIVILIFSAAFFRLFDRPIVWADDIAKFFFSWASLLGADVAMRYSRLVGVDIVVRNLPAKTAKVIQLLVFLIIIALLLAFVYFGVRLSIESIDRDFQTLSSFSYSYVTAALPVASFLMILTAITKISKILKNFKDDDYQISRDNPDIEYRKKQIV